MTLLRPWGQSTEVVQRQGLLHPSLIVWSLLTFVTTLTLVWMLLDGGFYRAVPPPWVRLHIVPIDRLSFRILSRLAMETGDHFCSVLWFLPPPVHWLSLLVGFFWVRQTSEACDPFLE